MSSSAGLVELIFIFGVALALGVWELWRTGRDIRRSREAEHGVTRDSKDTPP